MKRYSCVCGIPAISGNVSGYGPKYKKGYCEWREVAKRLTYIHCMTTMPLRWILCPKNDP